MAGIGFSVAYFLDAAQGRARRKRVIDLIRRARASHAAATVDQAAPDLLRIGQGDLGPRPTFQRAADGIRASVRA
jgi:hypothetical protein